MHSGVIQGSKFHHKRSDGKDDQPSKCTGDHSQLQHSGSVSSGFFQVSFSHDLPKKNGSRTCNGKTEYRANVPHHSNQGISGHRVSAKVSQDYRIHGKSNAPGQVVSKCRKWQTDKVLKQYFTAKEHICQIQLHIFTKGRYNHTANQLDQSWCSGGDCNAGCTKLRSTEQAEDKNCI